MKVNELVKYLEAKYPSSNASEIDTGKIGLQFGSMNADVKKVLIALDGSLNVIEEAISGGYDFILLHHPFLFYPLLSVNYDNPFGQKLCKVLEHRLNVFSMHTNFDVANGGMNDILANLLELKDIHMTEDEVSSKTLIRIGNIEPMMLDDFSKYVSNKLDEPNVRYVGKSDKVIKTIGVVGGSGASEMYRAMFNKCDCLVTGEVHHHQALDAIEYGFSLIEVSHSVERHFANKVKEELSLMFPNVLFEVSKNNINPYK